MPAIDLGAAVSGAAVSGAAVSGAAVSGAAVPGAAVYADHRSVLHQVHQVGKP